MTENTPRAVVLCEDRSHWHFIRSYLIERGWNSRQVTSRIAPPGKDSAEKWVIDQYPRELQAYRAKYRENLVLIVMIDGDKFGLSARLDKLEQQRKADQPDIDPKAKGWRVGVFVPCRNLETWMAFLNGENVDETKDYKFGMKEAGRNKAAQILVSMCRSGWPMDREVPASLLAACAEWSRLEKQT